jgi:glycosyltransferase involved in cell wall biosynthesis
VNKITAIIVARNEEKMIRDALESVSFCDEVIVVDSGSIDKTKEIAQALGAKVYEIKSNDFSQFRNLGLSKAENDWILYLDADERINPELKETIKKTIEDSSTSAFTLRRKNFYFGKHEWPKIEKMPRLFQKSKLKQWQGRLHESPIVDGEIEEIKDGYILHFTHRDLESMLNKTIEWSTQEALLRYNSGHPQMTWWRFPRVMLTAFLDSYIKQGGYKAGAMGVVESMYQSFSMFITYAKLWELQNASNLKRKT